MSIEEATAERNIASPMTAMEALIAVLLPMLPNTTGATGHASLIAHRFGALAREIARGEIAKLSTAPVGEDGPPPCKCGARDAFGHSESCVAEYDAWKAKPAPTPPAKDTEGEVWTEETLRQHAKDRGWYIREGTSVPNVHTGGYSHPFSLTVGSRELVEMLNAATSARIADLEARLAEATDLLAARADTALHWSKRAVTAERALADATKRIEALGRGLADADRDRTYWHRKWRALSPASEGKTDG